jgi:MoxR-like ATPase
VGDKLILQSKRRYERERARASTPPTFVEPITRNDWAEIAKRLTELVERDFDDTSNLVAEQIAKSAVTGLAATKRVFLLGEPGTGKTTFARLIRQAFVDVLTEDRLFTIQAEITDKTTETTLVGFV